jgi:hypothetical protein
MISHSSQGHHVIREVQIMLSQGQEKGRTPS